MSAPAQGPRDGLRCPRVLVTGAAGFVGRHLLSELVAAGHEVTATDRPATGVAEVRPVELRDPEALRALVRTARPDACVHLAAVSYVPDGDRDPAELLAVNVAGTLNLLEALRREAPRARLLLISTAQVYGSAPSPGSPNPPLDESAPTCPLTLYAISKVACEQAALAYGACHTLDVMIARPANHTGPGQSSRFVAPAFARQIVEVAAGRLPKVRVGNLDAVRDFTDVRDVVRAYRLLLERGTAGLAYNISADTPVRIGDLLERLLALAAVEAPVEPDPALVRPADVSIRMDTSRLRDTTGWRPLHPLDDTLSALIEEARAAAG